MTMLRFDVVAEMVVAADDATPTATHRDVWTQRDAQLARYRSRNAAYDAARRIPGFEGYSPRPGFDFVISGQHVSLTVGV